MYLIKNKKSPFYQVIYFINGKRTTTSTKTKNKKEADKFLESFKEILLSPIKNEVQIESKIDRIIYLSKFRDEYLEYFKPIKSANYIRSIQLFYLRNLKKLLATFHSLIIMY